MPQAKCLDWYVIMYEVLVMERTLQELNNAAPHNICYLFIYLF